MPSELHETYDETLQNLFDGNIPKRSVRLDMCQACVESFDFLVKLIANSRCCIYDLMTIGTTGNRKEFCQKNCERCIRSYVYKTLALKNKIAKEI